MRSYILISALLISTSPLARADTELDLLELGVTLNREGQKLLGLCRPLVGTDSLPSCMALSAEYSEITSRTMHLHDLVTLAGQMRCTEDRVAVQSLLKTNTVNEARRADLASESLGMLMAKSKNVSISMYADKLLTHVTTLKNLSERIQSGSWK